MKKFLIFILMGSVVFLSIVSNAQRTPVNEWTSTTPNYIVKGSGINYESSPGVFVESNKTIIDEAGEWVVDSIPMPWRLSKADKAIYLTRGDREIGIKPVGIYYIDKADWEFTRVGDLQVPVVTAGTNSILIEDLFPNVDMELISNLHGPQIDFVFKSKVGYPSAASLGMAPETTYVCIVHELDLTNAPGILADNNSINWNGTDASNIRFTATKNWSIIPSKVISSDAEDNKTFVRNFLVEKVGIRYFVEAIRYDWFIGKTFPVRIQ